MTPQILPFNRDKFIVLLFNENPLKSLRPLEMPFPTRGKVVDFGIAHILDPDNSSLGLMSELWLVYTLEN